jgi:hypothetical protein
VSNDIVYCVAGTDRKLQLKSDVIGAVVNFACLVVGTGRYIGPESPATNENMGTPIKCREIHIKHIINNTTDP